MSRSSSRSSGRRARPRPAAATALPTLSVVLPAYKVAPYLERCLDSLLTDAPPGLELIVVDDGSPDEVGEIAERRAASDPRLRVIHQENAGVAAARNAGLDAACGDYVGFADPDDMVEPGWARALLAAAARQRPAIVRGEWREVRRDGSSRPHPSCTQALQPTPLSWFGPLWCAIFRRDFLTAHHLRHPVGRIYSQDLGFVVQALVAAVAAGERIIPCPKACYLYLRRGGGNDRRALSPAHMASVLGILEDLHQLLQRQAAHLPAMGMAAQYYQYIVNLHSNYASRAQDPADAAAAQALARRLLRECPVPGELRQMHQQQLAASRAAGSPAVHPALQAFFAQAEQVLSGTAAPAAAAVSPPAEGGQAPATPPPQPAAARGWQADAPGGEPQLHAASGTMTAGAGHAPLPAAESKSDEGFQHVSPPAAGQGPVRQPPPAGADHVFVLLQRARGLLGEDDGRDGDAAELARCLRRLYRAQNRLDPQALRQLGADCLQRMDDAAVQAAAADLAGESAEQSTTAAAGHTAIPQPAQPRTPPAVAGAPPVASAPPPQPERSADIPAEVVSVVFCFNDRYCPIAAVALASLLAHVSAGHRYDIRIIHDDISPLNRSRLLELNTHDNVTLSFMDFDVQRQTGHDLNYTRHTRYAFVRLWLPQLLPGVERVLYLDGDLLLSADVAELFGTDLHGAALGAVADPLASAPLDARLTVLRQEGYPYDTWREYFSRHLKLPSSAYKSYFCTGVLLMDLTKCAAPLQRQLPALLERRFRFPDQDILNIIFHRDKHLLEKGWNVFSGADLSRWQAAHGGRLPPVLHFNGPLKPCDDPRPDVPGNAEYWRVLSGTPFLKEGRARRQEALRRSAAGTERVPSLIGHSQAGGSS